MSIKMKQTVQVTDGIIAYGVAIGDNLISETVRQALPDSQIMAALAIMGITPTPEQVTAYSH